MWGVTLVLCGPFAKTPVAPDMHIETVFTQTPDSFSGNSISANRNYNYLCMCIVFLFCKEGRNDIMKAGKGVGDSGSPWGGRPWDNPPRVILLVQSNSFWVPRSRIGGGDPHSFSVGTGRQTNSLCPEFHIPGTRVCLRSSCGWTDCRFFDFGSSLISDSGALQLEQVCQ